MQKPLAYSPLEKFVRDRSFSRREISVIAFVGIVLWCIVSFALANIQYTRSALIEQSSISSSGTSFLSGTPLP